MFIVGTRPEAIKLAPVILAAIAQPARFEVLVVRTSQHREMLDQMMVFFGLPVDVDLNIMRPSQDLVHTTTKGLQGLYEAIKQREPDWVVVQGDTTTTFVGALAAFYHQLPVAHVEAGLRTGKRYLPFPEELNRVMTTRLADLHFAPTELARMNLLREGVDEAAIKVTGNTAIDALLLTLARSGIRPEAPRAVPIGGESPLLLVTAHRRENQGKNMESICAAIHELVQTHPGLRVVFPMHLSPAVRATVIPVLGGNSRISLVEPMDYERFVLSMYEARLILTDSGGVQEEAPSLGKPVLVMRTETERPEAISAGTAILVGTERRSIVENVSRLLTDENAYAAISQIRNPFGDGKASGRILDTIYAHTARNRADLAGS
jgi:UDP-N-acetylglucosamine 2-epimerase (non-hydrolysing)